MVVSTDCLLHIFYQDPKASHDFNDNDPDPMPRDSDLDNW